MVALMGILPRSHRKCESARGQDCPLKRGFKVKHLIWRILIVGCLTRVNSVLLVGVLGFAIIQNLLASRDPQLAILYTLVVLALAMMGGGRFSVDAWLVRSRAQSTLKES